VYHVWEDLFFIFVPLGQGLWRVVLQREGAMPASAVQADELVQVVTQRLGRNVFLGAPVWLSRAPFYQRFADRLRQGRLLLAGDAAHLFSPIGGTGMNTGLQDALHLAWRLACLMAGAGTPDLLDSYARLRMDAMLVNGRATDLSTRLITRQERDPALIASWLPVMKNRPLARRTLPLAYSGLALCYPSLQARHVGSGGLCLAWPGIVQTLAISRRARGPALPVLSLLVHAPTCAHLEGRGGAKEVAAGLEARAAWLRCVALVAHAGGGAMFAAWSVLADDGARLAQQAGVACGQALLLLPDGIVAWRGLWPEEAEALFSEVDAFLPFASQIRACDHPSRANLDPCVAALSVAPEASPSQTAQLVSPP
jgi:hypothetical protein